MNVDDVPLVVDCTLQVNVVRLPGLEHPDHETYSSVVMFAKNGCDNQTIDQFSHFKVHLHIEMGIGLISTCIWPSCVTPGDNE